MLYREEKGVRRALVNGVHDISGFLFVCLFFNWGMVALQCCVNVHCTKM